MEQKSELELLLEKNASREGLSRAEYKRASFLIGHPEYAEEDCWLCKMSCPQDIEKAIYDTGLCQSHAGYALATRK
ncbi:MAG: hypothetical protein V1725_01750 [archaeon]